MCSPHFDLDKYSRGTQAQQENSTKHERPWRTFLPQNVFFTGWMSHLAAVLHVAGDRT